jgi:hypothetical protein
LGPLQDNTGPLAGAPTAARTVPTEAPLPGSPVIDTGVNTPTLAANDERGLKRLINARVDVGAVEFQPPATSTSLSTSGAVSYGNPLTFTAQVAAQVPGDPVSGTVTFSLDGTSLGTVPVSNGTATLTITPTTATLSPGNHMLTATYSGDPNFTPSSATQTLTAPTPTPMLSTTTTSLSTSGPVTYGKPLTLTAQVTSQVPGTPLTGTVTFSLDGTSLGTIPLSGGTATLTIIPTPATFKPGRHTLTATYNGDTTSSPSSATQMVTAPALPQLTTKMLRKHGRTTLQVLNNGQLVQQFMLNTQPFVQMRDLDGDGVADLVISVKQGKKLMVLAAFSGATAAKIA